MKARALFLAGGALAFAGVSMLHVGLREEGVALLLAGAAAHILLVVSFKE